MDDYKEHINYLILKYEAMVKELTPKPQSHIQAPILLKQWDNKQKEASHFKKDYVETVAKNRQVSLER